MFYKIVPYKWILYSYSNLLIAKINQTPLKITTRLFTVDSVDKLRYVISIYNKVFDYSKRFKLDNVILTPVANNWYTGSNKINEDLAVIPNAVFLLLKRPLPSNPYDFDLFKNDSRLWYKRLQQIKEFSLTPIFIYDPLHIPDIITYYIPLILVNKNNESGIHTTSCYTDIECQAYAIDDDFYILIGIWIPDEEINNVGKLAYANLNNLVKLCNPLFCSNPFKYDHKIVNVVDYTQILCQSTSKDTSRSNIVMEFLTSYIAIASNVIQSYLYIWLPVPSIELLRKISSFFVNNEVNKLLVIDILGNFSEIGSLSTDRMWIGILRYITKAKNIKALIGGDVN